MNFRQADSHGHYIFENNVDFERADRNPDQNMKILELFSELATKQSYSEFRSEILQVSQWLQAYAFQARPFNYVFPFLSFVLTVLSPQRLDFHGQANCFPIYLLSRIQLP